MDDEREEELSTIQAIYPELAIDPSNQYAATLDLDVAPSTSINVHFTTIVPSAPESEHDSGIGLQEEHKLDYLPSLKLAVQLPEGYPADSAPVVTLSTSLSWLPSDKVKELQAEASKLWEEYGHCQTLFAYIDYLQQAAERGFDLPDPLELPTALKPELLVFDRRRRKELFDAETFDCGICLEPKKGSMCHRMLYCGHVFCLSCLQDFYNSAITEGDVVNIRCLDPGCGKEDEKPANERKRKRKTLHPRELFDIGMTEPTVRRFVEMKEKLSLIHI